MQVTGNSDGFIHFQELHTAVQAVSVGALFVFLFPRILICCRWNIDLYMTQEEEDTGFISYLYTTVQSSWICRDPDVYSAYSSRISFKVMFRETPHRRL